MKIEFDPQKNIANLAKHGTDFALAAELDEDTALVFADTRFDYGEVRYVALAPLRGRLHVLVYTRIANGMRVISLRKANKREVKLYEEATTADR